MDDVISSYRYDVVWSNGLINQEENSVDEANYSSASAYSGDEKVVVDATSAGEKITKDINGKVDWVAVQTKYFAMILAPTNPSTEGGAYFEGNHFVDRAGVKEVYSASLKMPFKNQKLQKDSFNFYLGPINYYELKEYGKKYESIFEFGSFFGLKFIIRPISEYIMLPLFRFLSSFISNWGLVIIVFSILIKFALHPLTRQSLKSMKKMQLLQPKIAELKEKYKDNQQKVQQETMKLYSSYGINPMGGCLPMLLQMPILIALWSLFNVAIEIRQQPFMLWMKNLSSPDIIYRLPFKIPIFNVDILSGLALLMGITMLVQQKMSIKDPTQKALIYIMPVMFTIMFMSFPSGLNLYYFMFNLLSIAQQYYVNHKQGNVELVPVANPKKKQGFMARMMEAAEKQAQEKRKARKK
jgi:YidC/Oxa1 family membrane protein insertase